jgi:hypothetical protein
MLRSCVCALAIAIGFAAAPGAAHHSAAAQYEVKKTISLKGVVREFRFVNPHAVVRLAVSDDKGKEVVWSAEWAPTSILRRFGMKPDAIRPGDRLTIVGNPARDGSADLLVNTIAFEDGRRLGVGTGPAATPNNNAR